jgi:arsenate reductase (glutaredoxin)
LHFAAVITVYTYQNCSTCRKATAWLRDRRIPFAEKPIRETPPGMGELRKVLSAYNGDLRRLFNSSGQDYRQLNLKARLPNLGEEEALELLSGNGNLIKRPFLVSGSTGRAGFNETEWSELLDPSL